MIITAYISIQQKKNYLRLDGGCFTLAPLHRYLGIVEVKAIGPCASSVLRCFSSFEIHKCTPIQSDEQLRSVADENWRTVI